MAAQEKDGVKCYTCGVASTRVLLVYFQLWFLQGSPGISTCNAVTRTAQTDEVAAVWPSASAKRGARHLRTKCLLEDWNTAEALGNDIKGHVLWKLSTLRGCVFKKNMHVETFRMEARL